MSCSLRLPTIRAVAKRVNVELTATPSLNIDPSEGGQNIDRANDLLSAVKDSHLWITRAGACYVEASFAIDGLPILHDAHLESLIEAISNAEIWDRLGIRLEFNRSSTASLPGLLSFSLQHPDLSSALIAPDLAWTTPFRRLLIAIDVCKSDKRQKLPRKTPRTSKRQKGVSKAEENVMPCAESDLMKTLEPTDQDAIETFISSLNFPLDHNKRKFIQAHSRGKSIDSDEVLKSLHDSSLLDILFEQLFLAPEKTYKSYQVWGCGSDYCLTKLAPGVFHVPYLKNVSGRAQLLPVIAMSLARMEHAESPTIRQKVADLQPGVGTIARSRKGERGPVRSIEKRAWEVLVTHARVPSLANRRRHKRSVLSTATPRATTSETLTMSEDQPVLTTADGLSETHTYVKHETQESTTMSVSWNAIADSTCCVQHSWIEESPSFPGHSEAYIGPWGSPNISSTRWDGRQWNPDEANFELNDHRATATHTSATPHEQNSSHEVWMAHNGSFATEYMTGGPHDFETLGQWLVCDNRM